MGISQFYWLTWLMELYTLYAMNNSTGNKIITPKLTINSALTIRPEFTIDDGIKFRNLDIILNLGPRASISSATFKRELSSHASQSINQIKYYMHQYEIDWYLSPIINRVINLLSPDIPPLPRFAVQIVFAHPQIVYFNSLYEAGIFSKILEGELHIVDFILFQIQCLQDSEIKREIYSTIFVALKYALIGPLLAYLVGYACSDVFNDFTNVIIVNVLKSILTPILFPQADKPLLVLSLLPTILIAGSIRGVIFYYASQFFKNQNFTSKNIFYLSMIVRHIFEPQVKKLEQLNIYGFLTRIFSAA